MGARYHRKIRYQAMQAPSMERWKLFIPLSLLFHIILITGIDMKLSMPIPKPRPNKPITLTLEPIKLRSVDYPSPTAMIANLRPKKTVNKPSHVRVPTAKKRTASPVIAAPVNKPRQRYIKAPPNIAKKIPSPRQIPTPKHTPTPVRQARVPAPIVKSNIPDNLENIPRIGINLSAPAVITSHATNDMDNPHSIGIAIPTPAPVQSPPVRSPKPATLAQKLPVTRVDAPAQVQPARPVPTHIANAPKPEMPVPTPPPIKPTTAKTIQQPTPIAADNVKPSTFQQRLKELEDNVAAFIPVFPKVVTLITRDWLKLESIPEPEPTTAPPQISEQKNQPPEINQPIPSKNADTIPEQFMTDDRWHSKEVIQGNIDKQQLQAEQQEQLRQKSAAIIFKEQKNYGDVSSQQQDTLQNSKKRKEAFNIRIGDSCYLGAKTEEEQSENKNPLNCNF